MKALKGDGKGRFSEIEARRVLRELGREEDDVVSFLIHSFFRKFGPVGCFLDSIYSILFCPFC